MSHKSYIDIIPKKLNKEEIAVSKISIGKFVIPKQVFVIGLVLLLIIGGGLY